MLRFTIVTACCMLMLSTGCVLVKTPDVQVGVVGSPTVVASESPQASDHPTPHAKALKRVIRQQDKVAKELNTRNWSELQDEASDWLEYVQNLRSHAATSHDPGVFRGECDRLIKHIQDLRQAARSLDAVRCKQAIDACDPLLADFARRFPLDESNPPEPPAGNGTRPPRVP